MKQQSKKQQRGGTLVGFIVGVVVGLAGALGVAVYVTKVPVPFLNKGQSRSAEQDAAEAKKNKDWDPNAPLYGKNPAKAAVPSTTEAAAEPPVKPEPKAAAAKAEVKPAVSADPLADLVKAKSDTTAAQAFTYFVQVGAFQSKADADNHRAKLMLNGIETKVSEREQSGQVMYRVRVGPFESKEEGEKSKEKLEQSGLSTSLVRVQRVAP